MDNYIEQGFAGITSALGTTFEMTEDNTQTLITEVKEQFDDIEQKKLDLVKDKHELALKDQAFLEQELKSLIVSSRCMLAKLEAEIKIGSKSGFYDSYAKMITAINGQMKELRELNVAVVQTELNKKRIGDNINNNKRATIMLDANSLMDLIEKAKQNSQIHKIDAEFKIQEGDMEQ